VKLIGDGTIVKKHEPTLEDVVRETRHFDKSLIGRTTVRAQSLSGALRASGAVEKNGGSRRYPLLLARMRPPS